jgi:hypothetical protein
MPTCQRYRMMLQLFDAEQLRAQQLSILVITQRLPCACRKPELFDTYCILLDGTEYSV